MNYPSHLLPKFNYRKIKWTDELCPLFLSHHTQTATLFMDGTEKINPDNLITPTKRMEDLSTNLLGDFLVEDNQIEIIGKNKTFFTCNWNEGEKVDVPKYDVDFVLNREKNCVFWNIGEFIALQFSHIHNITNITYNLVFRVLHTPTRCNFWHFSIKVCANGNHEISTLGISKKLKKVLLRIAKEQLIECVIIDTPDFKKLDSDHYTKP